MQIASATPAHQMPLMPIFSAIAISTQWLSKVQADRSKAVHFDANPARPAAYKRGTTQTMLATSTERTRRQQHTESSAV